MKLIYFIVLFALSASAYAESPQEKLQDARHLVEIMDYKATFDAYLSQCNKSEGTYFDPITVFKSDPGAFKGISPQSAYWPEVEAAYRRYQNRVCEYFSADAFAEFFAQELASRISMDDLRTAIAFQSSAAGQRLQRASVAVNAAFQTQAQMSLRAVTAEAYKAIQSELVTIIEKYNELPK
jgi:hypothetical protein